MSVKHHYMTDLLQQQAQDLFGIDLTPEQVMQFNTYLHELTDWNTRINLTAIIEPPAVRVRHFLDSLSLIRTGLPLENKRMIDIGSGAGFPGIPLAIAFPTIRMTLLESTGKKIKFLDHIIQTLGLTNTRTLNARAEDAGRISHHRAHYDVVLARAVARLPGLVEYMLPLARVDGHCVAMKGSTAETEVKDAEGAIKILGGQFVRIESIELPDIDDAHHLVMIEKVKPTPKQYPRQPGIPTRQPLS